MREPPKHPPVTASGSPPPVIRDLRLYHSVGGHARDGAEGKPLKGSYTLEVHGFDRTGPFSMQHFFDRAPTIEEVLRRVEMAGER